MNCREHRSRQFIHTLIDRAYSCRVRLFSQPANLGEFPHSNSYASAKTRIIFKLSYCRFECRIAFLTKARVSFQCSGTNMKNLMPTHRRKFSDVAGVWLWPTERAEMRF